MIKIQLTEDQKNVLVQALSIHAAKSREAAQYATTSFFQDQARISDDILIKIMQIEEVSE